MRITDYPDLLRTKGKEPMPQAWDETNQDWTPAIDSAATLKAFMRATDQTLRTPAVGRRTVTATAAELFAGASRLASRRRLVIRNEDPVLRCLIGPATVSQQTGFPIEPGAVLEVPCDPEVAVPVYAISEGASLTVAVMEI